MPSQDPTGTMEWDTAQRIFRVGMVISFLVAALGIVGELLGWWNDVGEVLTTVGTLTGVLLGTFSVFSSASEDQVSDVAAGVAQANRTLGRIDEDLDRLDTIDGKLDQLETIDGKLDTLDAIDDDLDKVQVQLDKQTGVLDQQVGLLTEIRDRL